MITQLVIATCEQVHIPASGEQFAAVQDLMSRAFLFGGDIQWPACQFCSFPPISQPAE